MLWLFANAMNCARGIFIMPKKSIVSASFSPAARAAPFELLRERLLVELDDVVDGLELRLGLLGASGFHSNAPLMMLSMNQMSAVARCVASSQAVRDFAIRLVVAVVVLHGRQDLAGRGKLAFPHRCNHVGRTLSACSAFMSRRPASSGVVSASFREVRTNLPRQLRYLIRCGGSASAPSRRLRSAS